MTDDEKLRRHALLRTYVDQMGSDERALAKLLHRLQTDFTIAGLSKSYSMQTIKGLIKRTMFGAKASEQPNLMGLTAWGKEVCQWVVDNEEPKVRRSKTLQNLEPHAFGDSTASRRLVEQLLERGDAHLIAKMQRHWFQYTSGLNDIMPCQNSTQSRLFTMWRDEFVETAKLSFGARMEEVSIPFTYYENVLKRKYRSALDLGPIWQKMNS